MTYELMEAERKVHVEHKSKNLTLLPLVSE